LNRGREGLRVLEDTGAICLGKGRILQEIPQGETPARPSYASVVPVTCISRDSEGDYGREMIEGFRDGEKSIVFANFRRCEESLRVLEEYGRLFGSRGLYLRKCGLESINLEKKAVKFLKSDGD